MKHADRQPIETHANPESPMRRRLLLALAGGGGAAFLGALAVTRSAGAMSANGFEHPGMVSITLFDDHGKRIGERKMPRVIKTDAQWQEQLSPPAYRVSRNAGTESPFSGNYELHDERGIFRCVCCDTALFDSETQFHSGTGWPSFWQAIAATNVSEHSDMRLGMQRTEIRCARCDAHLGHKFHDGPKPTGLRYCMDSVAMTFDANKTA